MKLKKEKEKYKTLHGTFWWLHMYRLRLFVSFIVQIWNNPQRTTLTNIALI